MIPGLQQAQHPRGERTVEEGEQVAAGGEEAAAGDEGPMVGMAQQGHPPRCWTRQARRLSASRPRRRIREGGAMLDVR